MHILLPIKSKEKYDAVVVECHHVACVCVDNQNENPNLQTKNYFFFLRIWICFKIGKKNHLNSIGNGAEFRPLRTQKKIPAYL